MPEPTRERRRSQRHRQVRERPGWLVPLGVLVLTATLGAMFLLFYLAPNPASLIEEHSSPSARTDPVNLRIGSLSLRVPANYLPYASERQDGARKQVTLYASLPDFRGYSNATAAKFAENGVASPLIYMVVKKEDFDVAESAVLQRIYLNDVVDPRGRAGSFGLREYAFRNDSGYRDEDLLVGRNGGVEVVMRCARTGVAAIGATCFRTMRLAEGVALSYRFKRSHLSDWREIASGVNRLLAAFGAPL